MLGIHNFQPDYTTSTAGQAETKYSTEETGSEGPAWRKLTTRRRKKIDSALENLPRTIRFADSVVDFDKRVGRKPIVPHLTDERRKEIDEALDSSSLQLAKEIDRSEDDCPQPLPKLCEEDFIRGYKRGEYGSEEEALKDYADYLVRRKQIRRALKKYDRASRVGVKEEVEQILQTHHFEVVHTRRPPTKKKSALKAQGAIPRKISIPANESRITSLAVLAVEPKPADVQPQPVRTRSVRPYLLMMLLLVIGIVAMAILLKGNRS